MERASAITHPLEALTPGEKARLGYLILWAIDGPEQGFITNLETARVRLELNAFLAKNGIHAGGEWLQHAVRVVDEARHPHSPYE